jgi:T5orf172 domain
MEKQYVYILSNSEFPDLIKVGETHGNPEMRAIQLTRQTGAIGTYSVEWAMQVPDSILAEKIAHFKLKEYYHSKRELFLIKPNDAYLILEKIFKSFFEIKKPVIIYENKLKKIIYAKKLMKKTKKKISELAKKANEL